MKKLILATFGVSESIEDPIRPSDENNFRSRSGSQYFNIELEFHTNGGPIDQYELIEHITSALRKDDFFDLEHFIVQK